MASGGSANDTTVSDGLKKLFPQISQLKLLPDAAQHMQFIQTLEGAVMQYLQQIGSQAAAMGTQGAQGQQAGPGGGAPSPGGPPGAGGPPGGPQGPMPGGPGSPPAAQFQPGGGSGGGSVGLTPQINPDELRRTLAGASAGGNG